MNITHKICLALALLFPLAACNENKSASDTMKDAGNKVAAGWETLKAEVKEATDDASSSISELETKASARTGDGKAKMEDWIKRIKAKSKELAELAEDKSEAAGDKIKRGIADLKQMIHDATAEK